MTSGAAGSIPVRFRQILPRIAPAASSREAPGGAP